MGGGPAERRPTALSSSSGRPSSAIIPASICRSASSSSSASSCRSPGARPTVSTAATFSHEAWRSRRTIARSMATWAASTSAPGGGAAASSSRASRSFVIALSTDDCRFSWTASIFRESTRCSRACKAVEACASGGLSVTRTESCPEDALHAKNFVLTESCFLAAGSAGGARAGSGRATTGALPMLSESSRCIDGGGGGRSPGVGGIAAPAVSADRLSGMTDAHRLRSNLLRMSFRACHDGTPQRSPPRRS